MNNPVTPFTLRSDSYVDYTHKHKVPIKCELSVILYSYDA